MDIADASHDFFLQPGPREAIWSIALAPDVFPTLNAGLQAETVIVGGGITGVTLAAQLARAGRSVILLEARSIGSGSTGGATGNLYATTSSRLYQLAQKWGAERVREVVASRSAAISLVERYVAEYQLDCDFSRQPWVLYSTEGLAPESAEIEAEFHAAQDAGLDARLALDLPLPYMIRKALVLRNQAQFNPLRYVRGLAAAIQSSSCQLFEQAPVTHYDAARCSVQVGPYTVRGDYLVLATNVPKGVLPLHAELAAYREYAVAAQVERDQLPGGMFWSSGPAPSSTRTLHLGGKSWVLMVGERHKTGQNADADLCYRLLEARLQSRFRVQPVSYKWSAQQYRSADGLPYIGADARHPRLLLASGYGADGLAWGTLAGSMLAARICGGDDPYAELYSPARFTPLKSARNFLRENLNIAGQYLKDYVQGADLKDPTKLLPGTGALAELDGSKVAAYRDLAGKLFLLSPVCTHSRCVVHWNAAERSWDCPCHGSRFQHDGEVLEGPALAPLAVFDAAGRAGDAGKPEAGRDSLFF